jgi:hypothetical protein
MKDWCARARVSGNKVLQTMANTLEGHRILVLNWYDFPIKGQMARFGGGVINAIEDELIDALASEVLATEHRKLRNVIFRAIQRDGGTGY